MVVRANEPGDGQVVGELIGPVVVQDTPQAMARGGQQARWNACLSTAAGWQPAGSMPACAITARSRSAAMLSLSDRQLAQVTDSASKQRSRSSSTISP
jgi:hypothetical protein